MSASLPARMRILMTSDAVGGVGVYAETLARGLAGRGHQVTLLCVGGAADSPAAEFDGVVRQRVRAALEWQSELAPTELSAACARVRHQLRELGREFQPDILHSNQFAYTGALAGVPSLVVAHSDVVSWWRAVRGGRPPEPFAGWYVAMARRGLDQAGAVVAPSAAALEDLRQSFGFGGAGGVIGNGAEVAASPAAVAKDPGLAVCLGRLWDAGKQVELLERSDLGWRTVVAGDLTRPQVAALLARATVYVAPSRYEPFGLAPLEAALAGCALLLNDIPSFREIWGDGAAYFVHNDGDDMARQLRHWARCPEEVAARAAAARRRAQRYSSHTTTLAYETLYGNLTAHAN